MMQGTMMYGRVWEPVYRTSLGDWGGGGMVWEDRVLFHSPNWKANIPNPESVELATKEERINNNEET